MKTSVFMTRAFTLQDCLRELRFTQAECKEVPRGNGFGQGIEALGIGFDFSLAEVWGYSSV
jgi:hypothetical protein